MTYRDLQIALLGMSESQLDCPVMIGLMDGFIEPHMIVPAMECDISDTEDFEDYCSQMIIDCERVLPADLMGE